MQAWNSREGIRQILGAGHPHSFQQGWDNSNATLESSLYFQSHEVEWVIEPPPPTLASRQPLLAHQGNQNITGTQPLFDEFHEVVAGLDAGIHEDVVVTEPALQPVVQATGETGTVVSSVADENARHGVTLAKRLAPQSIALSPVCVQSGGGEQSASRRTPS